VATRLPQGGYAARLPDGRLHLQHGPIDLLIAIDAPEPVRQAAERRAVARFDPLLGRLAPRRAALSQAVTAADRPDIADVVEPSGRMSDNVESAAGERVAARMRDAALRLARFTDFVTPMAAVAGAVADEILEAIGQPPSLRSASVNNGGDIAIRLVAGEGLRIGLGGGQGIQPMDVPDGGPARQPLLGQLRLSRPGRYGIATSGWSGRSHSRGIADSVTVLADTAATADVAATLIANAVDVAAPDRIERRVARELDEASDLGNRAVTVAVGRLDPVQRRQAVHRGVALAARLHERAHVQAVFVALQGLGRTVPTSEPRIAVHTRG